MVNVGIIAEYNPYHNGHKYLYNEIINKIGADNVIAVMSGNFIQRGGPAMADKYARAESAALGGIDVVFELPVIYATGSARDFAYGATMIMDKMNVIDYLAFGVENNEPALFDEIAEILAKEPEEYKTTLNNYLSKGLSYPAASEKAINKILGSSVSDIISTPNNILAISYITALKKLGSNIKTVMIPRCDKGYNETELTGTYSSGAAIRNAIIKGDEVSPYIPKVCRKPYAEYIRKPLPINEWLTPIVAARLIYDRNLPPEISQLENIMDMTPELLNRLRKAPLPVKYVELQDFLKTKNITMSRVSRVLLHMVLGINNHDRELAYNQSDIEYLNLLAFKTGKSDLIKKIGAESDLKVINKKSSFTPDTEAGIRMWQLDKLATDLYNQLIYDNSNIRLHNELSCSVRKIN